MSDLINCLIEAQKEINHASQDGKNPYFKSNYATLEQVITTVKPALNRHGIYFQQKSHLSDDGVGVETIFYGHGSELSSGIVHIPCDKKDPQSYGSALTYAKRYSLSLACGIGHQKDDDAEQAMASHRGSSANKVVVKTKKSTLPPTVPDGKYWLMYGDSKLVSYNSTLSFITACGVYLKDPKSEKCKAIFHDSSDAITSAYDDASGEIKDRLEKLINLYGEA